MTLREYKQNKEFQCPLGDRLVSNIEVRFSFGMRPDGSFLTDEEYKELMKACQDIPDTIPLDIYAKDPVEGALVASEAFMKCVKKSGLQQNVEEIIYKRHKMLEGYSTSPVKPLEKCMTKEMQYGKNDSVGGYLASLFTELQILVNHTDPSFGFDIIEMKDIAGHLGTQFTLVDAHGRKGTFIEYWGMTDESWDRYLYDKVDPYKDRKTGRKRTPEEREEFLRKREEYAAKEAARQNVGVTDALAFPMPQEYVHLSTGKLVPVDSVDSFGIPIYLLDRYGEKKWIQPEKKELSEQLRAKYEKEYADYLALRNKAIKEGYIDRDRDSYVKGFIERFKEAVYSKEPLDSIKQDAADIFNRIERLNELEQEWLAENEMQQQNEETLNNDYDSDIGNNDEEEDIDDPEH